MLINDVILEKHYKGPLYHVTLISYAINILEQQSIKFTDSFGTDSLESKFRSKRKPDYEFYLSTSRSKLHAYRNIYSINKYHKVTFVIDPNKLGSNIVFSQINYWGNELMANPKSQESEERLWSNKEEHPIDFIVETHFYQDELELEIGKRETIELASLSEEKNQIPCYIYDDIKQYAVLNKKKAYRIMDLL